MTGSAEKRSGPVHDEPEAFLYGGGSVRGRLARDSPGAEAGGFMFGPFGTKSATQVSQTDIFGAFSVKRRLNLLHRCRKR